MRKTSQWYSFTGQDLVWLYGDFPSNLPPSSYSKLNYPVMAQLFIQLFAIVSVIIHHCFIRTAEVSAFSSGTTQIKFHNQYQFYLY